MFETQKKPNRAEHLALYLPTSLMLAATSPNTMASFKLCVLMLALISVVGFGSAGTVLRGKREIQDASTKLLLPSADVSTNPLGTLGAPTLPLYLADPKVSHPIPISMLSRRSAVEGQTTYICVNRPLALFLGAIEQPKPRTRIPISQIQVICFTFLCQKHH